MPLVSVFFFYLMIISLLCKIYFHYQFKKTAFTHKNFIDKMRPFSPDFKFLIWIFFPYWVIDRNSNNQNRIYSNICTSLFYGSILFFVLTINNENDNAIESSILLTENREQFFEAILKNYSEETSSSKIFRQHLFNKHYDSIFQHQLNLDKVNLLNSADFVYCQNEELPKLKFSICTNRQGLIKMIKVKDPNFSTPERLRIGMTYKNLSKSYQDNIQYEPGYGRWIELVSGWQAHLSVEDFDNLSSGLSESQIIEFQLK